MKDKHVPNNQYAVKLLPWPANIVADRHEISGKWVLHYLTDEQAHACLRAMNTPTPREQELEAQNKALWELVEECERSLLWFNANTADKNRWISQHPLAAIQKAKEAR
jgi:hypothetical protein